MLQKNPNQFSSCNRYKSCTCTATILCMKMYMVIDIYIYTYQGRRNTKQCSHRAGKKKKKSRAQKFLFSVWIDAHFVPEEKK